MPAEHLSDPLCVADWLQLAQALALQLGRMLFELLHTTISCMSANNCCNKGSKALFKLSMSLHKWNYSSAWHSNVEHACAFVQEL